MDQYLTLNEKLELKHSTFKHLEPVDQFQPQ